MASPEAMAKLRAVLDYVPEEAARRLDGDPQEYYDAVTRRLTRTVAVKSLVARKVVVERPDFSEDVEPEAPVWAPPPPEPEPEPEPLPEPEPEPVSALEAAPPQPDEGAWDEPASEVYVLDESTTVVEARELPEPAPPSASASDDADAVEDFLDVIKRKPGRVDMEPVGPDVSLNEREWSNLDTPAAVAEETAVAPLPAGEPAASAGEDSFEEVVLPTAEQPRQPAAPAPPSSFRAPVAEDAVAEVPVTQDFEIEEAGEVSELGDFEVLEEGELAGEPAYQINEFTLFRRDARAKSGKVRSSYFFSAEPDVEGASPSSLPEGYEVIVNQQTGIPVVRKSAARVLPIMDVEGVGPVMAERLERAGVRTTKDLLVVDVREISEETGISERLLGNFRAMAELLQLPGLGSDQAACLVYAGVRNLKDLENANAVELAKSIASAAKDYQLHLKVKVTPPKIKAWQERVRKDFA